MSRKRVWWKCPRGHSYQVGISDKVQYLTKCPICLNKIVLAGFNDLETTHPQIAHEWFFEKNSPLSPRDLVAGTARKVWWKCSQCNNIWRASVASRTRQGCSCPKCGIKRSANAKRKKVICLDTGEVFDSIIEAKQRYPVGNIGKCLHGESKTAGGYRWAFVNDPSL